jgi:hypothetical protein
VAYLPVAGSTTVVPGVQLLARFRQCFTNSYGCHTLSANTPGYRNNLHAPRSTGSAPVLAPASSVSRELSDFQNCLQHLVSLFFPAIQRLTRDFMGPAQLAHPSMCWRGNQQLTDPLNLLFDCATMMHVSSLRMVRFFPFSPYLSGEVSSIVTVVHAYFEPCLTNNRDLETGVQDILEHCSFGQTLTFGYWCPKRARFLHE